MFHGTIAPGTLTLIDSEFNDGIESERDTGLQLSLFQLDRNPLPACRIPREVIRRMALIHEAVAYAVWRGMPLGFQAVMGKLQNGWSRHTAGDWI